MKKKTVLLALLAITLSSFSSAVYAAGNGKGKGHGEEPGNSGNAPGHGYDNGPGQGPGKGNGYGHNKDQNAPIDGGLSLLIAAGMGVGLKKAHTRRKKGRAVVN